MNSINIVHGYEKLKGWITGILDSIMPNQELNTEISIFVGVLAAAIVVVLGIITLVDLYITCIEPKKLLHLVIFIACLPLIITIIILAFVIIFVIAAVVCYVAIILIFYPFRLLKWIS